MLDRWTELSHRIDCPALSARYSELDAAYSEPHRAYHGWTHVAECLDVWDRCPQGAGSPDEVELALWLHDVVYRPLRSDNEERSAARAVAWLEACPADTVRAERVRGLILATRHPIEPSTPAEALIQDVDLHILGAPPERYAEYEAQIRREYRLVPGPLFRRRRAELLQGFLDAEELYHTRWFRDRFEDAARRNLARTLEALA